MKSNKIMITTSLYLNEYMGVKKLTIINSTLECYEIKRNVLKKFLNNNHDLDISGTYFLLNKNNIYVGQTDQLSRRLMQHHNKRPSSDFDKIIFFMDKDVWSKTYFDYLEWFFIGKIFKQNNYKVLNIGKRGNEPKLSELEEWSINDSIDQISLLLINCGVELEETKQEIEEMLVDNKDIITQTDDIIKNIDLTNDIFYFRNAKIKTIDKTFVIYKDSIVRGTNKLANDNVGDRTKASQNGWYKKLNEIVINLIKQNKLIKLEDRKYHVINDIEVNDWSISTLTNFVCGNTGVLGLDAWKNSKGVSIREFLVKYK